MAGLDPAIHLLRLRYRAALDGRLKAAHGEWGKKKGPDCSGPFLFAISAL
jgi:hypothetical protein